MFFVFNSSVANRPMDQRTDGRTDGQSLFWIRVCETKNHRGVDSNVFVFKAFNVLTFYVFVPECFWVYVSVCQCVSLSFYACCGVLFYSVLRCDELCCGVVCWGVMWAFHLIHYKCGNFSKVNSTLKSFSFILYNQGEKYTGRFQGGNSRHLTEKNNLHACC